MTTQNMSSISRYSQARALDTFDMHNNESDKNYIAQNVSPSKLQLQDAIINPSFIESSVEVDASDAE